METKRLAGAAVVTAAAVLSLLGIATHGFGAAGAQSDEMLVKVVAPESVGRGADEVVVRIEAENATNLGAFQFQLAYDPDVLQVAVDPQSEKPLIQRGDFLGSTGREVVCPDPESQPGVLRMTCVTLRMEPAGPDGAGTLATVTFTAVNSGSTELTLDRVKANNPDATEITPIQVQSGVLAVKGGSGLNWALWGPIIGIVALVVVGGGAFGAMRLRGAGSLEGQAARPVDASPRSGSQGATAALPDPDDPYQVLGVRRADELSKIEKVWRSRVKKVHPDAGGSDSEASRLNNAMDKIRAERSESPSV